MVANYRCPKCSAPHSITCEKIFDGRIIFRCSKCNICSVIPGTGSASVSKTIGGPTSRLDEAYLDFLDRYEAGVGIASGQELDALLEQENVIRKKSEVEAMISLAGATGDALIQNVLCSKQDYVVDFHKINQPQVVPGALVNDLPVDKALIDTLVKKGIERASLFQEVAIKEILRGKDIIISAPTASGKTEAFAIPIIQKIAEDNEGTRFGSLRTFEGRRISAIFVYPTKALSRDQLPKIRELCEPVGLSVAVTDGDTKEEDKRQLTDKPPDIVITNFDVLHYHLLHRTKLSRLLRSAKFLVVDEAHVYTGVFGSNVHHIIQRLQRLAAGKIQIIAASATLPNASDFCRTLFGRPMELIEGTGRQQDIVLGILFPSLRSQRTLVLDLIRQASKTKHRTLAFSNSHIGSELTAFYAAKQGVNIRVHRAGLSAQIRKQVESQFRSGKLMAISSTPTLELGIDIGDIDAIVSGIVPINRLTQRVGRAGRRGQKGYAFLALGSDPISQYYKNHPQDYLVDKEYAYCDPSNPFVLEYQVLAMACDRPISMSESKAVWTAVQSLISKGLLNLENEKFVPVRDNAREVLRKYSIRGIGNRVDIVFNKAFIGDRALPQALEELHPNAIYFFSGRRYKVKALHGWKGEIEGNKNRPYAELEPIPSDYPYYTKALTDEWPSIVEVIQRRNEFGIEVCYCSLKIKKRVVGFASIEVGQEAVSQSKHTTMLDEPLEFEFITKGFVFRAPFPSILASGAQGATESEKGPEYVAMSAFHATEHVVIEGSAMITGGASQDLGGISLGSSGLVFVYDGSIGGNGASRVLYERLDKAFGRALRILSECPCTNESGCPRCTFSYRCGNNNEYLHKQAAIEVLQRIVEGERTEVGEKIDGERAFV